ncbi:MAG: Wzz/FepE/Etk N-terminal domain-containing protein [Candidatus Dojkabacteria bacterium]
MENNPIQNSIEDDFSFKKLFQQRKKDWNYLWKNKVKIIFAVIVGGLIGLTTSFLWPVTYTARLTFVVEDAKQSGGSLVSALAGQFGFDIGGMASTSGLMAGDNVLQLLKSNTILKRTLLTPYGDQQHHTLADIYAIKHKLKEKWEKKYLEGEGKVIQFPKNTTHYTRLQDSLLQDIILRVGKDGIGVSKPDKKLGFFELTATVKDEKLAQLLCIRVLQEGSDFYIQTKTKRLRTNVERLQVRADSITRLLNKKTYSASSSNQMLLDVNPAYTTAKVGSEVQERDKIVLSTIYSEVIKNLEVNKTMLMQETPIVQIVDQPDLPLKKNFLKWWQGIFYFAFFSGLFFIIILLFKKKD